MPNVPHRRLSRVASIAAAVAVISTGCTAPAPARAPELDSADGVRGGHPSLAVVLDRTSSRLLADTFSPSSEASRRATHEFLSGMLGAAWRVAGDARYLHKPRFSTSGDLVGRPGLFNPDNRYSSALLDPNGRYRIFGRRGSHAQLTLQFLDHYPLVGLGKGLLVVAFDALGVSPGEAFELHLGGSELPSHWWPMPEGARAVLVRQTFNDWQSETASTLRIERLDAAGSVPDGPSQMDLAAEYLERIAALWSDDYLAGLRRLPENQMPPMRPSAVVDGGLSGQQGVIARFAIEADDALVVTVKASDAAYQSIQVGDYWFVTPNPVAYQSSLNLTQSEVDSDGYARYVISERDPGIANWLCTGGATNGYIMLRWQGIKTPLAADDQPRAKRVSFDELDAELPPTTARMSADERKRALAARLAIPALKR